MKKDFADLKSMLSDTSGRGFERGYALEKLERVEKDAATLLRRLTEALLYVEYKTAYEGKALDHEQIKKELAHVRQYNSRIETAHSYVPLASVELMATRELIERVTGRKWVDVAADLIKFNGYQELK